VDTLYVSQTSVNINHLTLCNGTEELEVHVLNKLHNRGRGDKGTRGVGSAENGVQGA
jgi:hypothetical protein